MDAKIQGCRRYRDTWGLGSAANLWQHGGERYRDTRMQEIQGYVGVRISCGFMAAWWGAIQDTGDTGFRDK
jgi:hypothetical protein